jgi:hypothetical protein
MMRKACLRMSTRDGITRAIAGLVWFGDGGGGGLVTHGTTAAFP